jgi:hypothetical protein
VATVTEWSIASGFPLIKTRHDERIAEQDHWSESGGRMQVHALGSSAVVEQSERRLPPLRSVLSLGVVTRMTLSEAEIQQLETLEREAEQLLVRTAKASEIASQQTLERLESCAGAAAKLAFGSDSPHLLSEQMSILITWTDHLDDSAWVARFQQALRSRPLVSPWKR